MPESNDNSKQPLGILIEFDDPHHLVDAAKTVRDAGYQDIDAYSPFPVHGIDPALGIKTTRLPLLVFACGLTGCLIAILFQWWTNAIDYPYIISGKPLFSLPANIPVAFEMTILLAAFAAFFGMLAFNGLPKYSNPLFHLERFAKVTDNRFFLAIAASDKLFDDTKTLQLVDSLGGIHYETYYESKTENEIPKIFLYVGVCVISVLFIPPVLIWNARHTTSRLPRIHPILDMDQQVKSKTQTVSAVFEDGRTSRPRVPGTVSRTDIVNLPLERGIEFDSMPTFDTAFQNLEEADNADNVENKDPVEANGDRPKDQVPKENIERPKAEDEPNWVKEIPIAVTPQVMQRGKQKYEIYCAVCHGLAGDGDGLVAKRAVELEQSTWVQPTSIHAENVQNQPVGKLFHTASFGIRKMKGYSSQISNEDRWAIVLYLKALQKTRKANIDDLPKDKAEALQNLESN